MATFFGEVVPVFSRAVEEEEEDEDEEIRRELEGRREITIQWSTGSRASTESSLELSFTCSTFLIAVGQNAVGFLNSFVQCSGSWEIIGAVTFWNERVKGTDTVNRQFPTDSSCLLYRLTSNPMILTCHCRCYMADDQLFQWTEKVFGNIQKRNLEVIILSSCSVTEYKSPSSISNLTVPFLRALKTSAFQETPHCPLLEQPNVISGLSAAVLSYCQVRQISAVLYHCYSDVTTLDSLTIEAFRPLLACKSLVSFVKDTSRSAEILKQLVDVSKIQSNLYT
ncbi:proteasome assembly chaperone 1 isoform X1 [Scyliorhinus canicula]|uniref:proteasome assembly chaperone 1 isoform X1 n=1 Tax=Scyliorhinus canicula TaxID=7830 RepID=UPI0018F54CC8|nr:proteasome assembly chaperone 1 isoform X1 [Scyliorhinus canicula]